MVNTANPTRARFPAKTSGAIGKGLERVGYLSFLFAIVCAREMMSAVCQSGNIDSGHIKGRVLWSAPQEPESKHLFI